MSAELPEGAVREIDALAGMAKELAEGILWYAQVYMMSSGASRDELRAENPKWKDEHWLELESLGADSELGQRWHRSELRGQALRFWGEQLMSGRLSDCREDFGGAPDAAAPSWQDEKVRDWQQSHPPGEAGRMRVLVDLLADPGTEIAQVLAEEDDRIVCIVGCTFGIAPGESKKLTLTANDEGGVHLEAVPV